MFEKLACKICGGPLDSPLAEYRGVCDSGRCQGENGRQQAEIARKGRRRARQAVVDRVRIENPQLPPTSDSVVVPANLLRLVPADSERQATFRRHLEGALDKGFDGEAEEMDDYASQEQRDREADPSLHQTLGRLCGVCRGGCCINGREHAFVDAETIRHVRHLQPGVTMDELREQYVGRLPEESYEGACVFQGEFGCVLPRDIRGLICNRFFCEPLVEFTKDVHGSGKPFAAPLGPLLAISVDEDKQVVDHQVLEPSTPSEDATGSAP